jgi:hypothetical protein
MIVAKGIKSAFLDARRMRSTKCIGLDKTLILTHLLIVDDVLLLFNGSGRGSSKLREILKIYFPGICMMVNMQKPSIAFNEVAEEQIKMIPHLKLPSKMQIIGVLYQTK